MFSFLEIFKQSYRDNFGSLLFCLIAGFIGFVFVMYLLVDYVRTWRAAQRRKRQPEKFNP